MFVSVSSRKKHRLQVVQKERMHKFELILGLHEMVTLFAHPSYSREDGDFRVCYAYVLLGPCVHDQVRQGYRRACATDASTAVNDYLFFRLGRQNCQDEVVHHCLEGLHGLAARYAVVRPAGVVKLFNFALRCGRERVIDQKLAQS
jgi:hypothetical protein